MSLFRPTSFKRVIFFVTADILLSLFSLYLAYQLRFNFDLPSTFARDLFLVFFTLMPLKIVVIYLFKIYFIAWRFFGLFDMQKLFFAHLIAYGIFLAFHETIGNHFWEFSRGILLIDLFLSFLFLGFLRISKRLKLEQKNSKSIKKCAIIGVTPQTTNLIKSMLNGEIDYYPVAIFDTDSLYIGTYISNLKVYDLNELKKVSKEVEITSVIFAKKYEAKLLNKLYDEVEQVGIKEIKQLKLLEDKKEELRDLSIEDLLAREPKDLDMQKIKEFINQKSVLITGAGGSIGSQIAKECKTFGASRLILVDNCEYNLYKIGEEIKDESVSLLLLSVIEKERLDEVFSLYKPDIVIHAAAYKHVPLCEENIDSAVINNVYGSKNVIDLSIKYNIKKVVIISTDKAVRPTNVMGATKRVVELYAQNIDSKETEIVSVRFGNVLGSSGSVVPKFKEQIQKGEDLTVTHPEVRRYFMLVSEACRLVLQAAAIAKGGEIFILDMGEPVKIVDLAKKMIKMYNKEGQIGIKFIGLRPGEKLYEELLLDDSEKKTQYESIHVARSTKYDINELTNNIEQMLVSKDKLSYLKKIVPEFDHKKEPNN